MTKPVTKTYRFYGGPRHGKVIAVPGDPPLPVFNVIIWDEPVPFYVKEEVKIPKISSFKEIPYFRVRRFSTYEYISKEEKLRRIQQYDIAWHFEQITKHREDIRRLTS